MNLLFWETRGPLNVAFARKGHVANSRIGLAFQDGRERRVSTLGVFIVFGVLTLLCYQ
jgi:hypothetical protein